MKGPFVAVRIASTTKKKASSFWENIDLSRAHNCMHPHSPDAHNSDESFLQSNHFTEATAAKLSLSKYLWWQNSWRYTRPFILFNQVQKKTRMNSWTECWDKGLKYIVKKISRNKKKAKKTYSHKTRKEIVFCFFHCNKKKGNAVLCTHTTTMDRHVNQSGSCQKRKKSVLLVGQKYKILSQKEVLDGWMDGWSPFINSYKGRIGIRDSRVLLIEKGEINYFLNRRHYWQVWMKRQLTGVGVSVRVSSCFLWVHCSEMRQNKKEILLSHDRNLCLVCLSAFSRSQ